MNTKAEQPALQSRAERTDYVETSRYQDVMEFIGRLQQISPSIKVESFGKTSEGRDLPLVILSRPALSSPHEASRSSKPVVFIMANIHAGEVEGKEAMLHIMRDIAGGQMGQLLDRMVLLVAPIYNADGNEKIDINNRSAQNGPLGGVGTRENAQSLDLNRDFMKMESPEARGLIQGVFNRWDPHVTIDLHTTNGSYHGYALTYSPSLNPNTDRRIISLVREKLLPDVTKSMRSKYKYQTYFYGNFVDEKNPFREIAGEKGTDPKAWATFDYRPRFGNNYEGLRNRIAILSEAYSYLDFRARVDVTDKFVREILAYIADHPKEIVDTVRQADMYAIEHGRTLGNEEGFGIAFELKPSSKPATILVGSVTKTKDSRTGKMRFEATGEARPVKMRELGEFRPTRRINPPAAYVLKPGHKKIVELLLMHGVVVERMKGAESLEVEQYEIQGVTRAARAFQGHRETKLKVSPTTGPQPFPAGSFLVTMRQPKAALVFYLLEPESDDGIVNWNILDEALDRAVQAGSSPLYPIFRLKAEPGVARELIKEP